MVYVDTSVLVAVFAREPTAAAILALLADGTTGRPVISDWNMTEFAAAISFRLKLGSVSEKQRHDILLDFQNATRDLYNVVPVTTADFHRAATFANQADLRLRGGDALHLSIAAGRSLSILTLDKRMVAAANTLGVGIVPFD